MNQMLGGSFRLFQAFGIQVHLHWTWFLLFLFLVQIDRGFATPAWNVAIIGAIFGIVLLHEFGHALACRSVGGRAEHIMLWPLGGVAFVQPPRRPGAVLWSIAAGPLVNVLLVPVLYVATLLFAGEQAAAANPDLARFVSWVQMFNIIILVFNMLPIYPLDGGQVLHALLWFVLGHTTGLRLAAGLGLVCAVAGGLFALMIGHIWLIILAVFVGHQAWMGWQQAKQLAIFERQGHL